MRPPRLLIFVFCLIFLPILLTFYSALSSSSHVATPSALAGPTTGLHALFSFNIPSSLFPPSAIISLTDDNSTFFLARPAAFGPLLPEKGFSGPLWVGSGFGEAGPAAGVTGDLGCSDIPGWGDADARTKQDKATAPVDQAGKSAPSGGDTVAAQNLRRADSPRESDLHSSKADAKSDGTDDHLHHPLSESVVGKTTAEKRGESSEVKPVAHADIQSLQESAEIAGKIVLLSRGGCGFLEKVKWVQRRGGTALIVGDDTRGGSLVTMYAHGDTSNVTIPSVFTSHTTAQLLSSLLPRQVAGESNSNAGSKASTARQSAQSSAGKQRVATTATSAISTPTPSRDSVPSDPAQSESHSQPPAGVVHNLLSSLGLSNHGRPWHLREDSRRPPSSGNIDWVVLDHWNEEESSSDDSKASIGNSQSRTKTSRVSRSSKKSGSRTANADSDEFVIGVHDWRDPDLVLPKSSNVPTPSTTVNSQYKSKVSSLAPASLKGGSITPGSGEYHNVGELSGSKDSSARSRESIAPAPPPSGKGWLSRHLSWADDKELDSASSGGSQLESSEASAQGVSRRRDRLEVDEHEGLWVTLTPTSMSTSPFFDTLLVLVISPLLTLSIVYALLLLRSRIRRRRWRAPKSLVERLPVRTYHTIVIPSPPSANSRRSPSPISALPTSPLLGSRPRSQMSGIAPDVSAPAKEKSTSSSVWRSKYTGKQVECVVCLEEYIDGQSRVMSLPCGHEFHAECM